MKTYICRIQDVAEGVAYISTFDPETNERYTTTVHVDVLINSGCLKEVVPGIEFECHREGGTVVGCTLLPPKTLTDAEHSP